MAIKPICTIPDCGKRQHHGGLCSMHAERKRKHGDPLKGSFVARGTCSLVGCDKPHYGNGFCRAHWKRAQRYGNPLAGSTPWGSVRKWIEEVAIPYSGDDCLIFPYSRDTFGYGKANIDGRNIGVHVFVTARTKGPKPSRSHEACHSCGNGHLGCVNPKHIRWGTRSENIHDAVRHGTWVRRMPSGERAIAAKYSDAFCAEIRRLLATGETQTAIARKVGAPQSFVSRIKLGHRQI